MLSGSVHRLIVCGINCASQTMLRCVIPDVSAFFEHNGKEWTALAQERHAAVRLESHGAPFAAMVLKSAKLILKFARLILKSSRIHLYCR